MFTFYYAGLLLQRDLRKADKLIAAYQNYNEKLIPVMNLTFKIIKEMGALGMDVPSGYMETFSEWMKRAADEQLRRIKEEHDYKALGPAIALFKGGAIMTSDFSASSEFTQKYLEKIKKAMTFRLKFEISAYAGIAEQRMTLSGEAEILFLDENNENSFTGTGTGKYLSYTHSGPGITKLDLQTNTPLKSGLLISLPATAKKSRYRLTPSAPNRKSGTIRNWMSTARMNTALSTLLPKSCSGIIRRSRAAIFLKCLSKIITRSWARKVSRRPDQSPIRRKEARKAA